MQTFVTALPTCDVHLVRTNKTNGVQNGDSVTISFVECLTSAPAQSISVADGTRHTEPGIGPVITILPRQPNQVELKITPGSTLKLSGTNAPEYIKFNVSYLNVTHQVVVKVSVHDELDYFWLGNSSADIHEGENNLVISVFAKFDGLAYGDISKHPYIAYSSSNNNIVTVNSIGRITGVAQNTTAVAVTATLNRPNGIVLEGTPIQKINSSAIQKGCLIYVNQRISQQNRSAILQKIHEGRSLKSKRNILLMPEGFASKSDFISTASAFITALKSEQLQPWGLCQDAYDIWFPDKFSVAHEGESGISVAYELCEQGSYKYLPAPFFISNPVVTSNPTILTTIHGYAMQKNTAYGFAMGTRLADRCFSGPLNGNVTDYIRDMYSVYSEQYKVILRDSRRMSNNQADNFIYRLINTFSNSDSTLTGNIWTDVNSKDYSMIVFLAKDSCGFKPYTIYADPFDQEFVMLPAAQYTHVNLPQPTLLRSAGSYPEPVYNINRYSLNSGDNRASIFDTIVFTPPVSGDVRAESDYRAWAVVAASSMAHELTHTLHAGDEYLISNYLSPPQVLSATDPVYRQYNIIVSDGNELSDAVDTATNKLKNASKIKWNWRKVLESVEITSIVADGQNWKIGASIDAAKVKQWETIQKDSNHKVFLRVRELPRYGSNQPTTSVEFKIISVNITEIVLSTQSTTFVPAPFAAGSVLYAPRLYTLDKSTYQIQKLIRPIVENYMTSVSAKLTDPVANCGVEPTETEKNIAQQSIALSDFIKSNLSLEPKENLKSLQSVLTLNPFYLIGLYEGAVYKCGVFRPSGTSLMRKPGGFKSVAATSGSMKFVDEFVVNKLNDVCRYIIVNHFSPELLGELHRSHLVG